MSVCLQSLSSLNHLTSDNDFPHGDSTWPRLEFKVKIEGQSSRPNAKKLCLDSKNCCYIMFKGWGQVQRLRSGSEVNLKCQGQISGQMYGYKQQSILGSWLAVANYPRPVLISK